MGIFQEDKGVYFQIKGHSSGLTRNNGGYFEINEDVS